MTDLDRRYLLRLLLRSFQDASPGLHRSGDAVGGRSQFGSRAPLHTGESRDLWKQGSYAELDRLLTRMGHEDVAMYHAVYITYIYQPPRRPKNVTYHEERKQKYAQRAEEGLSWLLKRMPSVRVPKDIIENSGHVRRPA